MKRVLHVIDSLDLGGAQTFLLGLCTHLNGERYQSEVACMHGRGVYEQAFREVGVNVRSLSPGKFPPKYILEFARILRREHFDILHFHLFGANLCAKPLACLSGHRAIVVHDQCNDASRDRNPVLLAADAFWNRRSGKVIAVSESTRRYLLDREDLRDDLVTVIPNGVDTDLFHPATAHEKTAARASLGIPDGVFVIGGIGRLVPQKNFPLFLESVSEILLREENVMAILVGTGPLESELKAKASRLGIAGKVRFTGHLSDRPSIYHAMDVLLMTSLFEGTPMVLLEAMASGLPVVASSVDGIAEVCSSGHDALLVADFKAASFQQPLTSLQKDPARGFKIAIHARETVVSRYGIEAITRGVEAVYADLLAQKG